MGESRRQSKLIAPWKTDSEIEAEEQEERQRVAHAAENSAERVQRRKSVAPWKTDSEIEAEEAEERKRSAVEKLSVKRASAKVAPGTGVEKRRVAPWKTDSEIEQEEGEKAKAQFVAPKSDLPSQVDIKLVGQRSKNCIIRFVSLVDDGFENPDASAIRRRMETLLLIGALVFSMVTSVISSLTSADFDSALKNPRFNLTVQSLADLDLPNNSLFYSSLMQYFISNSVKEYTRYAQTNRFNPDAFTQLPGAMNPSNIFYMERINYERRIFIAEIAVLVSFFCTGLAFFSFK